MSHPLDRRSTELAFSLAPIDCDGHDLGRAIAMFSLAASALVARYTDDLEPVAQEMSEDGREQARQDVSTLLNIAHYYSMDAGPRDFSDEDLRRMRERLEEWGEGSNDG
jgi:hypothetical protein